jgi:hypothetical protein
MRTPPLIKYTPYLRVRQNGGSPEQPHRGYRNMGKRPIETIEEAKKLKPKSAA